MPPAIKPSAVQPMARTAGARRTSPDRKGHRAGGGCTGRGANPKDATVGPDIAHADARAEFAGRPLWSALAECSGRMDLIQVQTGDSTRLQSDSYARRAAYVLWGNRAATSGGSGLAGWPRRSRKNARALPHASRQAGTSTASARQPPLAHWGQVCWGLDQIRARLCGPPSRGEEAAGRPRIPGGDEAVQRDLIERDHNHVRRLQSVPAATAASMPRLRHRAPSISATWTQFKRDTRADPQRDQGDRPEVSLASVRSSPKAGTQSHKRRTGFPLSPE